jgi:hypothetical protein
MWLILSGQHLRRGTDVSIVLGRGVLVCIGLNYTATSFGTSLCGVVTKCAVVQYKDSECLNRVLPTAHGEHRAVDIIIVNHLYAGYLQLYTSRTMFLSCILLQ